MAALGELFKQSLCTAVGNTAAVFDYGSTEDFMRLWGAYAGGPAVLKEVNGKQAIIIVWDGRSLHDDKGKPVDDPGAQLLVSHLTPLDWALALSIKVLGDPKLHEQCNFSIHILDLTGKSHDEWAMRMRFQLLAEMPWVTLHAPLLPERNGKVADYRKEYRPIVETESLVKQNGEGLVKQNGTEWTLVSGTSISLGATARCHDRLKDLARQWSASLTASNDHHDVNNVFGPWVVVGDEPDMGQHPSIGALYRRLMWMGLQKDESGDASGEPCSTAGPLDVMVIDDQMHYGWHNVLQDLLGINFCSWTSLGDDSTPEWTSLGSRGDINLFGCQYPSILDLLPNGENKYFTCRTFDSNPYTLKQGDPLPWMLVLDLHLHSGVEELAWLNRLLPIAREITKKHQDSLAWPEFDQQDEIEVIDAWLTNGANREDTAYDIALSLFPRLCALRWPAVPILIFSGTGRRGLISRLAAYGNIFLVAQKPNVLGGDSAGQVEAFRASFQGEFRKAMPLVDVQRALIALESAGRDTSTAGGGVAAVATQQPAHRHLTIAFEESGNFKSDSHSAIGGVLVEIGGTNAENAQLESHLYFEALRAKGVNFYDHVPAYTDIQKVGEFHGNCVTKGTNVSANVSSVRLLQPHCKIGAFRCLVSKSQYHANGAAYTDGTYLEWLGTTVELLLAEYLPSLGYDLDKTTLSIWFPTRSVPGVTPEEAMRCDFRYNNAVGNLAETIGGHSVAYAILTKAMVGRTCFTTTFKAISSLKVRKIPYWKDESKPKPSRHVSALHWYCVTCGTYSFMPRSSSARWKDLNKVTFSHQQHEQCRKHKSKYLAADYSVAQHLADAALSKSEVSGAFPHTELGITNVNADLSIDVDAGERLSDFLQAGRLFDRKREADGFNRDFPLEKITGNKQA